MHKILPAAFYLPRAVAVIAFYHNITITKLAGLLKDDRIKPQYTARYRVTEQYAACPFLSQYEN